LAISRGRAHGIPLQFGQAVDRLGLKLGRLMGVAVPLSVGVGIGQPENRPKYR